MYKKTIVWLRRDLRLEDNPAMYHAVANSELCFPLYIWDDTSVKPNHIGQATKWWLHHSLISLQRLLNGKNIPLLIQRGKPEEIILSLITRYKIEAVYCNQVYEDRQIKQDDSLYLALKKWQIPFYRFQGSTLTEPSAILNSSQSPFKVFTPYYKCILKGSPYHPLFPSPQFKPHPKLIRQGSIHELNLTPSLNWADAFSEHFTPGRDGAIISLNTFARQAMSHYQSQRDLPSEPGTSKLSPHLHYGEISPREIWSFLEPLPGSECYLRQLVWREFAIYLLHHYPHTPFEPLYPKFKAFPWKMNTVIYKLWCQGKTGYPIVDAGMKELWHTGWMHNRVRMIVASFLVKDLLIPWKSGFDWFMDTLLDADLANNTLGWQWVAGCGADAAPFFRIFNPILQGEKFDPRGSYIRTWVPELKNLPDQWIHKPFKAPALTLKSAGIALGKNYPNPIVDHTQARNQALLHYRNLRTI